MITRREFLWGAAALRIAQAAKANAGEDGSIAERTGVVATVLGPLETSKLGFTLSHEHAIRGSEKIFSSRASSVADAVDRLKEARDAGIATVVDLSPGKTGGMCASLKRYRKSLECRSWCAPGSGFFCRS